VRKARLPGGQLEQAREVLRDIESLLPHNESLFQKVNFLMQAAMGFINIEQNRIIKIFSVVSVVFLPPTLVASSYGMNFEFMPELKWSFGYLEEERRLAYVGVTRAMQKLTLTYAETRRLYGKEVYHRPSRFIGELPEECVEEVRLRASVSRPVNHQRMGTPVTKSDSGFTLGQRVQHAKFGEGTIVNMEGSGEHSRLQVAFQGQGIKWLVAAYARLEPL